MNSTVRLLLCPTIKGMFQLGYENDTLLLKKSFLALGDCTIKYLQTLKIHFLCAHHYVNVLTAKSRS